LLLPNELEDIEGTAIFNKILSKDYEVLTVLKNDHRSKVEKIKIDGKHLVLKVPKEKNTKSWIRFLTWFRSGEAFKNIDGMMKLWDKGIKTTVPLMAAEKRTNGMVTNSWLLYEYLKGNSCLNQPETYNKVVEKLRELHSKGLLHGDPQIRNFMVTQDDIYVIDANPKRTGLIGFDRAFEFAYLKRSQPEIEGYFGEIKDWWLFKFARWYDLIERKFTRTKRAILNWLNPFSK